MNLVLAGTTLWLLFTFLSACSEGRWPNRKDFLFFGVSTVFATVLAYFLYGMPK